MSAQINIKHNSNVSQNTMQNLLHMKMPKSYPQLTWTHIFTYVTDNHNIIIIIIKQECGTCCWPQLETTDFFYVCNIEHFALPYCPFMIGQQTAKAHVTGNTIYIITGLYSQRRVFRLRVFEYLVWNWL